MTFATRLVSVDGVAFSVSDWSEKTGISIRVINHRLSQGWTAEDAVGLSATNGNNQHLRYKSKKDGKMKLPMTIELAEQMVAHRNLTKDTWIETVKKISPEKDVNSARSYVNKYLNGKVKVREEQVAAPENKAIINYNV